MRTLRLTLAGTVSLTLLGGLGGVAMAQDADDEMVAATHVTGTVTGTRNLGGGVFSLDPRISMRGALTELDIEWTDPRLPSKMRVVENWDMWPTEPGTGMNGAFSVLASILLEDPVGAWTGPMYALVEETTEPETHPQTKVAILSGEGDYEGLSAMFTVYYEDPPASGEWPDWEGYILDGELPPMPEPLEPSAE